MKEYRYRGFTEPIIVDDEGNITYRGYEVEEYYHGYNAVGCAWGFSVRELAKAHYIEEMKRIDEKIRQEKYREEHKEEFEKLPTADEDMEYFFEMFK